MIKQKENYCDKTKEKRFEYVWDNFYRMEELLKTEKESLQYYISNEKAYQKKNRNQELGVRIQKSNDFYSLTEEEAIERVLIGESIEKGRLSEELLKEVENVDEINRMIFSFKLLRNEYKLLQCHILSLPADSKSIIFQYINKEATLAKLSGKFAIEENSVKQRIYRIKKQVKEMVFPFMENYWEDR